MAPIDDEAPIGLPLEYIVNHVFLPPKLPQLNDMTTAVEVGLTRLFHDTLLKFIGTLPEEDQDDWVSLRYDEHPLGRWKSREPNQNAQR